MVFLKNRSQSYRKLNFSKLIFSHCFWLILKRILLKCERFIVFIAFLSENEVLCSKECQHLRKVIFRSKTQSDGLSNLSKAFLFWFSVYRKWKWKWRNCDLKNYYLAESSIAFWKNRSWIFILLWKVILGARKLSDGLSKFEKAFSFWFGIYRKWKRRNHNLNNYQLAKTSITFWINSSWIYFDSWMWFFAVNIPKN